MPNNLDFLPTEYAKTVWNDRYPQTKPDGAKETVDEVFHRIAKTLALDDGAFGWDKARQEEQFFLIQKSGLFIGAGRHLCNLGGTGNNMPANCYVLDVEDSREGIYKTLYEMAEIESKGGGVGINFSKLRPKGTEVKGSRGIASGPCSFIDLYNASISTISQGGSRRGALLALLNVNHPDIEEFITAKQDHSRWGNLNVSVGVTDAFMVAVQADDLWTLEWGGCVSKTLPARELWNLLCTSACQSGEPGVFFLDRVNEDSPLNGLAEITAPNPCLVGDTKILTSMGYRPISYLAESDSFYLISDDNYEYEAKAWCTGEKECITLTLSDGKTLTCTPDHVLFTLKGELPACETLDKEIITDGAMGDFPIVESIESAGLYKVYDFSEPSRHRGFANGILVHNCGELPLIPYGACNLGSLVLPNFYDRRAGAFNWELFEKTIKIAVLYLDNLLTVSKWPLPEVQETVLRYRQIGLGVLGLADLLFLEGLPYGSNPETLAYVERLFLTLRETAIEASSQLGRERGVFPEYYDGVCNYPPRRNATLLSMAPTGTISLLYGASWAIEPYYSEIMIRNERLGKHTATFQVLDKWREEHPEEPLPDWVRFAVGDTNVLTISDHLDILASIARYVDNAISKTINAPRGTTPQQIDIIFTSLWTKGIKGGTVYVEGSREVSAVENAKEVNKDGVYEEDDEELIEFVDLIAQPKPRPPVLEGRTYKVKYAYSSPSLYITINDSEDEPFEIFFSTKDAESQEWLDMLGLALTALFRRGISCEFLVKDFMQYESTRNGGRYRGKFIASAAAAIGMVMKEHYQSLGIMKKDFDVEGVKRLMDDEAGMVGAKCPICYEYTYFKTGGCSTCLSCGHSACD